MTDDENAINWDELSTIEDEVLEEYTYSPSNYGKKGSAFNPQFDLNLLLSDCEDLMDVALELNETNGLVLTLKSIGWESEFPIEDGVIKFYWAGEGTPPIECSNWIETNGVMVNAAGDILEVDDDE